jgi:tRNA-specific 2-thiouridylase
MRERIAVAMSGGVDSSVAAALLKKQGFDVIGLTMYFDFTQSCVKAAKKVADRLKIRHYALNMQQALDEYVIKDFCRQYFNGRTPNPCVRCNKFIKFNFLLKKAFSLGAKYLATGHYARISKNQEYLLKKGKDKFKDQSYFLYCLRQEQLKHIMFPLGNFTKLEVRKLAQSFNLGVAEKKASQEICFLPNQDYREFLKKRLTKDIKAGSIVDKNGNLLGEHRGIAFYTVGQREGLGIAKGYPLYITEINNRKNRITVGTKEDSLKKEFLVKELNFISKPAKKKVVLKVKIRYNHKEALAEILPVKNKIKVKFKQGQFAITPGQSAVFYDKDTVIGGGIVDKVLN